MKRYIKLFVNWEKKNCISQYVEIKTRNQRSLAGFSSGLKALLLHCSCFSATPFSMITAASMPLLTRNTKTGHALM